MDAINYTMVGVTVQYNDFLTKSFVFRELHLRSSCRNLRKSSPLINLFFLPPILLFAALYTTFFTKFCLTHPNNNLTTFLLDRVK
jgi:hypothetical protein